MNKQIVLLLCGGRSAEHEVSLVSAQNVLNAIDTTKYTPIVVVITKNSGSWFHIADSTKLSTLTTALDTNFTDKDRAFLTQNTNHTILQNQAQSLSQHIDVVLPILHGRYGEDGCLQGMCRMLNLPCVGPSVAASAACMDKDFSRHILNAANIPGSKLLTFYKGDTPSYQSLVEQLGSPFFIKPANTGSSIGVYKVKSESEFAHSFNRAFLYDNKVVIEQFIQGREIECAVLGNESPIVSGLGEIKPTLDFYSYEAKYIDPNGAELILPAKVNADIAEQIKAYAFKAYTAMGCEGLSRIDFFLTEDNKIYLNEINTIPGFTNISMYPKLFEHAGIPYQELISKLIELALSSHANWVNLSTEHQMN